MPAPSEIAVLKQVAGRLDSAGIAYMLTGSFAASFYAQPRMTRDLDIVAALREADASTLDSLFSADFLLDTDAMARAIRTRGMFNLIHAEAVMKVDIIVRKDEAYRQVEFERRRSLQLEEQPIAVVAPEDLIISKLAWAQTSHSELQLRDVRALLTSGVELDRGYLKHWAAELGLDGILAQVGWA